MRNKKLYETYIKYENGKYYFVGWYEIENKDKLIKTKTIIRNNKKRVYNTYKYLNGTIKEHCYIIE